jgi:class 3 adenylate cyclase
MKSDDSGDSTHMRPMPPVGTVTFLFSDIEGSTALVRALGAG